MVVKCTTCQFHYGPNLISKSVSSPVCRLCLNQRALEKKLVESNKLIECLTHRVDALQEFISTNIGTDAVNAAPGLIQSPTTARSNVNSLQVETNTSVAATSEAPATTPPTTSNIDSLSQDSSFHQVRNGAKQTTRTILPITTYNKFQILAEAVEEPHDVRLIGDSIIRQQIVEFCGRAPTNRKRYCIPGASIDDVAAASDKVTDGATNDTLFIFHVGTNDVKRTRSEALLQKYRKLIQHYKNKSNNVLISGVLPRISADNVFYSKAFSLNNRLRSLCLQEGVEFIDTWDQFFQKPDLFASDGLHLNSIGSARYGRLLSEAVRCFWSKNAAPSPPSNIIT